MAGVDWGQVPAIEGEHVQGVSLLVVACEGHVTQAAHADQLHGEAEVMSLRPQGPHVLTLLHTVHIHRAVPGEYNIGSIRTGDILTLYIYFEVKVLLLIWLR